MYTKGEGPVSTKPSDFDKKRYDFTRVVGPPSWLEMSVSGERSKPTLGFNAALHPVTATRGSSVVLENVLSSQATSRNRQLLMYRVL